MLTVWLHRRDRSTCTEVIQGVETDCPVQLRLTFFEDGCEDVVVSDITINDPSHITVPDCCTPETLFLEDPEGVVLDSADSGFSSGDCVNDELDDGDFDVEFCCDKVTVSVDDDLECPVTATLNLQSELEDACSETTITKDLSPENRTVVFTVDECGCVPTSVVINGFIFDPEEPLNCICENFEELCKKRRRTSVPTCSQEADSRPSPAT